MRAIHAARLFAEGIGVEVEARGVRPRGGTDGTEQEGEKETIHRLLDC